MEVQRQGTLRSLLNELACLTVLNTVKRASLFNRDLRVPCLLLLFVPPHFHTLRLHCLHFKQFKVGRYNYICNGNDLAPLNIFFNLLGLCLGYIFHMM